MLKRLFFIVAISVAIPIATQANANPFSDAMVLQLKKQGYDEIRVGRTLLGRIRIVAISPDNLREMIVHPITGEILRDYSRRIIRADEPEGSVNGGNEQPDNDEHGDDQGGNDGHDYHGDEGNGDND